MDNYNGNENELFSQYRRLFERELERHEVSIDRLINRVSSLEREQAILKTKAMILGTVAGALMSSALTIAIKFLK